MKRPATYRRADKGQRALRGGELPAFALLDMPSFDSGARTMFALGTRKEPADAPVEGTPTQAAEARMQAASPRLITVEGTSNSIAKSLQRKAFPRARKTVSILARLKGPADHATSLKRAWAELESHWCNCLSPCAKQDRSDRGHACSKRRNHGPARSDSGAELKISIPARVTGCAALARSALPMGAGQYSYLP